MKIFISTSTFAEYDQTPLDWLKEKKITYVLNPGGRQMSEKEIGDVLRDHSYDGLIAGTEPLTQNVLSASALKVISRVGVGLDNVDLAAAKNLGIAVFNTPGPITDAVAELTLGLMLDCLRKISLMDRRLRQGVWKKEMGRLLKDKVVGIVGFGAIGRRVAELAQAFGAKVIFTDVREVPEKIGQAVSLEKLFAEADIISLHLSGKEKVLDAQAFGKMKKGVVIINAARGTAYDEAALCDALKKGDVFCAGLDAFEKEPYQGPLTQLENVVLTPHIGSYAKEARVEMEKQAVKNLMKGLQEVRK